MNEMTVRKLIRCGEDMRRLQKEYFQTRDASVLRECKGCERHFDDLLKAVRRPVQQAAMGFGGEGGAE